MLPDDGLVLAASRRAELSRSTVGGTVRRHVAVAPNRLDAGHQGTRGRPSDDRLGNAPSL